LTETLTAGELKLTVFPRRHIAGLVAPRRVPDFWWLPSQFAIVFVIVGLASLIATGLCALLKWEDQRVRAREKPASDVALSGSSEAKSSVAAPAAEI